MCTTFHVCNVTLEYLTNVSWSYRSQTIFFSQCDSLPEERLSRRESSLLAFIGCAYGASQYVIEGNRTLRRPQCKVTQTAPLCRAVQQMDFESV